MREGLTKGPVLALGLAAALALLTGEARADGYNLRLEGDYATSQQKSSDASGMETKSRGQSLADTYRLSLTKGLYESLVLAGDGFFEDVHSRSELPGSTSSSTSRNWAAGGRLDFGGQLLGGGASYDRRQTSSASSLLLEGLPTLSASTPTIVSESLGASLSWRPIGLLPLNLRVSRASQYDLDRTLRDDTTTAASLDTSFSPTKQVDGTLNLGYAESEDHLRGSSSASWSARGSARYSGALLGRGTIYLSDSLTAAVSDTRATGPGGTVATQQFATAGLALIEALPATPSQSTLKPLPALVDGNTADSAGINLGTSAFLRGDIARRHMGLQFPDVLRPVNTLYVWVSQPLPASIASQFTWSAYQSDDNVTWTPVALAGPVVFGTFESRFEITIPATRARYLKVVTAPLLAVAGTDSRFSDILVTELQAYDIVSAASIRGWTSAWANSLNGGATMPLTGDRRLVYDLSFTLGVAGPTLAESWLVANGLSWSRPLSPRLSLAARLQRTDTGASGQAHSGATTWGATLSAQPLPTLSGSLGYNGAATEVPGKAIALTNGLTGLLTANIYEGVSATAAAGGSLGISGDEISRNTQATLSVGVTPAAYLTFTGSYGLLYGVTSGGSNGASSTVSEALSGSVSVTPVPALSLGASATHLRQSGQPPLTLGGFQIGYSPFRGGSLLISLNHSESFENQSNSTARTSSVSMSWRLTAWAQLTAAYTRADSSAPLGRTEAQSYAARLTVRL